MPPKKEAGVERADCWNLVVHYYPRAALNDVKPTVILNFGQKYEEKDNPAYYQPHIFHFLNPPTKEEFLAVCAKLPWTHIWDTTLLVLIRKTKKWPKIRVGFKSARIVLKTKDGQVGELVIERITVWKNSGATPQ